MFNQRQFNVYFIKFMRLLKDKLILAFLVVSVLVPFVISVVYDPKEAFIKYEQTRSACFFLVMGAILLGMFNSFMVIYNERKVIRYEYIMKGLSLPTYVMARALSQFILCMMETLFMLIVINWRYRALQGDLKLSLLVYMTLLLTMFASDMIGLFISTLYKNYIIGVVVVVLVIILELALSGFLTSLKSLNALVRGVSYGMVSKWGSSTFFRIANLVLVSQNDRNTLIKTADGTIYAYSFWKVLASWGMLIVFALIFAALATYALRFVKKDKR